MNKLGSEFFKDFDQYDRPILAGLTLRMLVLVVGVVLVTAGCILIIFFQLSDIFTYLLSLVVMPPFIIYGLNLDESIKDRVIFFLKVQKRGYQTTLKQGDELYAEDFKQAKKIKEFE